jgi:hypothetical protein
MQINQIKLSIILLIVIRHLSVLINSWIISHINWNIFFILKGVKFTNIYFFLCREITIFILFIFILILTLF